ncbi:pyruvate kinase [Rhodococcus sp. 14-2470-1b]|uniref:pyruvate kinase n=1 Tax=Rhodococcus sp. 14-2470-1b TaxID=2023149 RepID=UPI000B9AFA09|nr:pyruvate kinase [Rhodococcus sp. 14-2470-1b]OZF42326.1 pyruvate kinase [Rhodococcus sp. 14-2470-1b]
MTLTDVHSTRPDELAPMFSPHRAKIVCTMGPATATDDATRALIVAGMNVARLNFSHGEHQDHRENYDRVRSAAHELGSAVAVLADLQGPKIRLGRFTDGGALWAAGDIVRITVEDCDGSHERVSTTYSQLAQDASPGDRLLVDDGKITLVVIDIDGNDVVCRVVEGGPISNNKGVSLPGMNVSVPALSDKDIDDLEFALRMGVDLVALSFVRSPSDIDRVHAVMDRVGRRVPVMAKIEKPEAVEDIEAIVLAFDAIMVARGDLGVEVPLEDVPLIQKRIIQIARENARPVVVATQMLESMIDNSRPTRAEAADVANAVLDGADAVMLSGETSIGTYPVDAVRTMARILDAVETHSTDVPPLTHLPQTRAGVVSYAARDIAERLGACALVAFTRSGNTVRRLARLHTPLPVLAFTPVAEIRNELALTWGSETFVVEPTESTDLMIEQVDRALLSMDRYRRGDLVVIVAGGPHDLTGTTTMIRVHRIGHND